MTATIRPPPPQIVPATPANADAVAMVQAEGLDGPWDDAPWSAADWAVFLVDPTVHAALAIDAGGPVGLVAWRMVADDSEILTLCVVPAARRRGLGGALLDHALGKATEAGCRRMALEVAAPNEAAIALYHARGFSPCGRRRGYYTGRNPHAGPVDAIVLVCTPVSQA